MAQLLETAITGTLNVSQNTTVRGTVSASSFTGSLQGTASHVDVRTLTVAGTVLTASIGNTTKYATIASSSYAVKAGSAASADNAVKLNGKAASQYASASHTHNYATPQEVTSSVTALSSSLVEAIQDNEETIAAALNDLDEKISSVSSSMPVFTEFVETGTVLTASIGNVTKHATINSASFAVSASKAVSASRADSSSRADTAASADNATKLNGQAASYYAVSASTKNALDTKLPKTGGTVDGDLVVTGDFVVNGTTTSVHASNLVVADKLILVASGSTSTASADGAGIAVQTASAATTADAEKGAARIQYVGSRNVFSSSVGFEAPSFTGSFSGTASRATSASRADNANSASYVPFTQLQQTGLYLTASVGGTTRTTQVVSSSRAVSAASATSASQAENANKLGGKAANQYASASHTHAYVTAAQVTSSINALVNASGSVWSADTKVTSVDNHYKPGLSGSQGGNNTTYIHAITLDNAGHVTAVSTTNTSSINHVISSSRADNAGTATSASQAENANKLGGKAASQYASASHTHAYSTPAQVTASINSLVSVSGSAWAKNDATTYAGHFAPSASNLTSGSSTARYYIKQIKLDGKGHVVGVTTGNETVTNTDTKVTAVGNHYTPAQSTVKAATAGQALTGIGLDAAGHVTSVTGSTAITAALAYTASRVQVVQNNTGGTNYYPVWINTPEGTGGTLYTTTGSLKWLPAQRQLEVQNLSVTHYAKLKYGYYAITSSAGNTAATGSSKVATIKITSTYVDYPIFISILERHNTYNRLRIAFNASNSADPTVKTFTTEYPLQAAGHYYMVKSATSTWDLYATCLQTYENYAITNVECNAPRGTFEITWHDQYVATNPTATVTATWNASASYADIAHTATTAALATNATQLGGKAASQYASASHTHGYSTPAQVTASINALVAASGSTWAANTDTKVTSAANHYKASGQISGSQGGSNTTYVHAITLDAAGHVTAVSTTNTSSINYVVSSARATNANLASQVTVSQWATNNTQYPIVWAGGQKSGSVSLYVTNPTIMVMPQSGGIKANSFTGSLQGNATTATTATTAKSGSFLHATANANRTLVFTELDGTANGNGDLLVHQGLQYNPSIGILRTSGSVHNQVAAAKTGTITLVPGRTFYIDTPTGNITIATGSVQTGYANIYHCQIKMGATLHSVTVPGTLTEGSALINKANTTYEISILNGVTIITRT